MSSAELALRWIMDILTNLVIPACVWALVIFGLVWVVQDKLKEDRGSEIESGAQLWNFHVHGGWGKQKSERS